MWVWEIGILQATRTSDSSFDSFAKRTLKCAFSVELILTFFGFLDAQASVCNQ